MIKGFRILIVSIPEYPEVLKFVRIKKATVYINTEAHERANIVRLIV